MRFKVDNEPAFFYTKANETTSGTILQYRSLKTTNEKHRGILVYGQMNDWMEAEIANYLILC